MKPEFLQLEHAPLPSSPLHLIFRFRHLAHWRTLVNNAVKQHSRALETYCHGDSFARWSTRFALTVGRWAHPTGQNDACVILFSVSVGMRKLQRYSSLSTLTELEFGTIERPTR